ncbi:MAG: hypothetical protein K2M17_06240 [Bacilli bacterium]|nr:hypothetical protein [Bacilli bacterium]
MDKLTKQKLIEIFPSEEFRLALLQNDYFSAFALVEYACKSFSYFAEPLSLFQQLSIALDERQLKLWKKIYFLCKKTYFLKVVCRCVAFYNDLYSEEDELRDLARANIREHFEDLTDLSEYRGETDEELEAFFQQILNAH